MEYILLGEDQIYFYLLQKFNDNNKVCHLKNDIYMNRVNFENAKLIIFPLNGVGQSGEITTSKNGLIILNKELYKKCPNGTLIITGVINEKLISVRKCVV